MLAIDDSPYRLSGTVYGVLANHPSFFAMLGEAASQAPYNGPPTAPVLYVKPRNTLARSGAAVTIPADIPELESAAGLGLVIGRTACRLSLADAKQAVAGVLIVNDVSVPHATFHRPSIRFKARDGFCPLGPRMVASALVSDLDALEVRTFVDGKLVRRYNTSELLRSVSQLLVDVTDFMTLSAGDVLCVGTASPAPRVSAGQTVAIEIEGVGVLENPFVRSEA